ncbi:hypothetical protein SUGI_0952530 [Cryptomeria japonica]|nr:hypothetical protein SUGI_0952530 [Cryptomeria japonica]
MPVRPIDESNGFNGHPVEKSIRSMVNIVFTLGKSELESEFIKHSIRKNMVQPKGHRSVAGVGASICNACHWQE